MIITKEVVEKLNKLLDAGLVKGLGVPEPGQMCVEAAVCAAMGMEHSDEPICVSPAVRAFKIELNDSPWSSNQARAEGMRKIAVAQLGSNTIDDAKFAQIVALKTVQRILPPMLDSIGLADHARACENALTLEDASVVARHAARYTASWASSCASSCASNAANAADTADTAASWASNDAGASFWWDSANCIANCAAKVAAKVAANCDASNSDKYLLISADICLEALIECGSPGVEWL